MYKIYSLQKSFFVLNLFILLTSCNSDLDENQSILNEETSSSSNIKKFNVESSNIDGDIVTINFLNSPLTVEKIDDQFIFEGDIIVSPDNNNVSSKSVGRTIARWEDNIVYYEIDNDLPNQYRVTDAILHWEENTSLRFYPKTDTTDDYITFQPGSGCSSSVGKIGGQQYINLSILCSTGNTIHEIGHAIGLWHEQSRVDRDEYIIINFENITEGKEHNFQTYEERFRDGDEYSEKLDLSSIMMYPSYAFSSNGSPTITTIDGDDDYPYQRDGLSEDDIAGVLKMYPYINNGGLDTLLPTIKNPSFTSKETPYDNAGYTCSCAQWYNANFPKQPSSSTDSNDDAGLEGGGSIKLDYDAGEQRTAYQLLDNVTPGVTYKLTFYYAIQNSGTIGELDFRVLNPNAINPATVTSANTIAQHIGKQTDNTNSIKEINGGGQIVELEFTATTDQVALYAVNSIENSSDVRIDNFSIEITNTPITIPNIENPTFSIKEAPYDDATYTCSCAKWYNTNFSTQPSSSTDSNDDAGSQGGGSIKLDYDTGKQRTAYQLLNDVTPGITYKVTFYYAIQNIGTIGELDFRILTPDATKPSEITSSNTIAQYIGLQTSNTNSIKEAKGGGQIVELEFTATTNQVALYAVNSVENGSDVRVDNFSIEIAN